MIGIISGGIGSGKSLSAVRLIVKGKRKSLTNFKLKKIKSYHRLKWDDMIIKVEDEVKSTSRTTKYKEEINWGFWKKQNNCSIYLDEMHNITDSRNSMSKKNQLITQWLSQVRKIFGQSGDQNYLNILECMSNDCFGQFFDEVLDASSNIIAITQRVGKIDSRFREMSHFYIQCQKLKLGGEIYILQNVWFGDDNVSAVDKMMMGGRPKKFGFWARPYYDFYDSYELISTGGEYL